MKKDFRWRGWIVLASLLIALVILSTTLLFNGMHKSTAYAASKPSISVPAVIRAFHPFKISGKGFAPGDSVTVYSTNAPIGTFQCGNNGRFTGTATVSDPIVQGTHQLSAIANSNLTATVNYTYLPGLILYDNYVAVLKKGGPGTLIFLAGAGFTANEAVNIYWGKNPTPITQATTDAYGNLNTYDVRFNAPTGIAPGKYPITVKRTQQKPEVVSTNFTVLPPKLVSSGGILAGQAINAKLSGFQANEQVAISWNVNGKQTIATIAVDTNGAANTTFTPPSAPKGPQILTATGNTSGLQATSITNIGPGISLEMD